MSRIGAGRLRHKALQLLPSTTQDGLGLRQDSWTDGDPFWCDLRSDTADERAYADGVAVVRQWEVRARWNRIKQIGLDATNRISIRGKTLKVRSITNLDEDDFTAVIDCEEVE